MFHIHIGEDLHLMRAEQRALAEQIVCDAMDQSLVGDARAAENINADEARARPHEPCQRRMAIVPQHVDPEPQIRAFAHCTR